MTPEHCPACGWLGEPWAVTISRRLGEAKHNHAPRPNVYCPWCSVPLLWLDVRCSCTLPCGAGWCAAGVEVAGACP